MHVCVYMYAYMYIYIYACDICMYVCMYVCIFQDHVEYNSTHAITSMSEYICTNI